MNAVSWIALGLCVLAFVLALISAVKHKGCGSCGGDCKNCKKRK